MRNKEATIKKILQSANDEFAEHGFEQASVRVIAKNAGVTPGAIYKHFKSKEDIFKVLVSPTLNHLYRRSKELTNQAIEEIKVNGLQAFGEKSEKKIEVNDLNDDELHVLYTMACTPLFEVITHRYPYNEALNFIDMMEAAMNFGWRRIIK